jgi:hypothetical protein
VDNKQYYWWKDDEKEVHQSVFSYLKYLDQDQAYRQNDNFKHMKLYGNYDLANLRSYQYQRSEPLNSIQNRVTMNIIQSMVDTAVSKIGKNRPKPTFLTEGGNFMQQRVAKKLSQFVEGQFQATKFYDKATVAFQDACIFGTGCLKIFKDGVNIKVERVFIDEVIVDDRESFYGEPRQMHQKKFIHKDVLKEMFPKDALAIDMAAHDTTTYYSSAGGQSSDMILVIESWHLPSASEAKDGVHAITINNTTLFREEYNADKFPFIFFRWNTRPLGFFGQGISEQLTGLQLEINKILKTIQVSMHLISVPKIFVEASSKIVDSHLDNRIGGIIKYSGQVPTPGQLGTIPTELFSHLDRLYQRAYEIIGISQLTANAAKPAGLDSGKAIREYNDLETERFMSNAQRYERTFLDAAEHFIELAKEIDSDMDGKYSIKVKGKKFMETIKWKDVSLDKDQYIMSLFPSSALSASPAGKLQDIQELIQAGFVSREDALKLLDFPDLQGFYQFETAAGEDINMVIEKIIEHGEYTTPEPYQDLGGGIKKMQQAYLLFRSENAPESRLELIRRWVEDANALMQRSVIDQGRQQQEQALQMQQMASEQLAQQTPAPEEDEQQPQQAAPQQAPVQ